MCTGSACDTSRPLTFETLLTDPLIRLVMLSDGVTLAEMVDVMVTARQALVARERAAYRMLVSAVPSGAKLDGASQAAMVSCAPRHSSPTIE